MTFKVKATSICLLFFFIDAGASQESLYAKATISQQGEYNDNLLLSTSGSRGVFGYYLSPKIELGKRTKEVDILLTADGNIRRYDLSSLDCNGYGSKGFGTWTFRPEMQVSFNGAYGVNCIYAVQLSNEGILAPTSTMEYYSLGPSWNWKWTARNQLSLLTNYSHNLFEFRGNSSLGQNGIESYSAELRNDFSYSQTLSVTTGLSFRRARFFGTTNSNQDIFGFISGFRYSLSRSFQIDAGGGPTVVDSRLSQSSIGAGPDSSSTLAVGYSTYLNVNYLGELDKLSFGFTSNVSPSAFGQSLQNNGLSISYNYSFSRDLGLFIDGNFLDSNSLSSSVSGFHRTGFSASTGLQWNILPYLECKISYAYRYQKIDASRSTALIGTNGQAESNSVMMSLVYSWDSNSDTLIGSTLGF